MADREAWLKTLALVVDGHGETAGALCPACGREHLEVRYIVDINSRVGYALLWCCACLHGISASRVRAPDSMPIWSLDDSAAVVGVPEFIRDG